MLDKYSMRPYAHVYSNFDLPDKVSDKNYMMEWNSLIGVMRIMQFSEIDRKPFAEVLITLADTSFYYRSLYDDDAQFTLMREENFLSFDYGRDASFLYTTYQKFFNDYSMSYKFMDIDSDALSGKRIMKLIYLETIIENIQHLHNTMESNLLLKSDWLNKFSVNEISDIFTTLQRAGTERISEIFLLDMPTLYCIASYGESTLDVLLYARKLRTDYGFDLETVRLLFTYLEPYASDLKIYGYIKEIIYHTRELQDILNFFDISHRYEIDREKMHHYLSHHSRECRTMLKDKKIVVDALCKKLQIDIERYKQLKKELREREIREHATYLYKLFHDGYLFEFSKEMTKLSMNLNSADKKQLQDCLMNTISEAFEHSIVERIQSLDTKNTSNNLKE